MQKYVLMIEIDKKLHKEIKEYCRENGLIMKDYVNSLLKKAFTADKFGNTPFEKIEEVNGVLPIDYETPKPINPTLQTDYETPEPVETVLDISKKEVPNNFYGTIQYDESWKEKFEENIEKGLIVTLPYRIETNGPAIVVNHSKKEETSVQADKVKKEEKQKKPKKRNL